MDDTTEDKHDKEIISAFNDKQTPSQPKLEVDRTRSVNIKNPSNINSKFHIRKQIRCSSHENNKSKMRFNNLLAAEDSNNNNKDTINPEELFFKKRNDTIMTNIHD